MPSHKQQYYHRTPLLMRKRKTQFTKPMGDKVEIPPTKRNVRYWWYDENYYCSTCKFFFNKKILFEKYYCGVCKNKQRRVRLQSRSSKTDTTKAHYNEKYTY